MNLETFRLVDPSISSSGSALAYVHGYLESGGWKYAGKDCGFNAWNHKAYPDPNIADRWMYRDCGENVEFESPQYRRAMASVPTPTISRRYTSKEGKAMVALLIKAGHPWSCFRVYSSLDEALREHLAALKDRYPKSYRALQDPTPLTEKRVADYAYLLKSEGYYTAEPEDYASGLVAIWKQETKEKPMDFTGLRRIVEGESLAQRYWRIVSAVCATRQALEPGAVGCAWTCNVTQRAAIWHCNRGQNPKRIPIHRRLGVYGPGWGILDGLEAWLQPVRVQDVPGRLSRGECLIFWQRAGAKGTGTDHVWCGKLPEGGLAGGAAISLDVAEGGQSTGPQHGHVTRTTLRLGAHGAYEVVSSKAAQGPDGYATAGAAAVVQGIYCLDDLDLDDEFAEANPPKVVPPEPVKVEPAPIPKAPITPLSVVGTAGVALGAVVAGGQSTWWIWAIVVCVILLSAFGILWWLERRKAK